MSGKTLAELRRLDRTQIGRLTMDDLISAILAPDASDQTQFSDAVRLLVEEMRGLRESLKTNSDEIRDLKETIRTNEERNNSRIDQLEKRISSQDEIIKNQQGFFEKFDASQRETKLVVLGVPDEHESLDGATDDAAKLGKVWEAIGETAPIQRHQRLGRQQAGGRSRPILVHVATRDHRDSAIGKARRLKEDAREPFKAIYVKKDVHPVVRKEWGRLRGVLRTELARPENAGENIRLDTRERKIYKNDIVIDSWRATYF